MKVWCKEVRDAYIYIYIIKGRERERESVEEIGFWMRGSQNAPKHDGMVYETTFGFTQTKQIKKT